MGALLFFKGETMELNEAIKKVERMAQSRRFRVLRAYRGRK